MNLSTLPTIITRKGKRLGLGHGSGRGKTSGRGTKGQKARRNIALSFEGGGLPLIKRLPFRRGKGKNKQWMKKQYVVNVSNLEKLPKNTKVTIDVLIKHNLVQSDAQQYGVKILGQGTLTVPLEVCVPFSKSAKEKIEKAGGKIAYMHE